MNYPCQKELYWVELILYIRNFLAQKLYIDRLATSNVGMDTRAYRLSCLKDSDVFEVDFPQVLDVKTTILQAAKDSSYDSQHIMSKAKSLTRVAADIRESDWLEKLEIAGYLPEKSTVWILEGILYYLTQSHAMQVLRILANKCALIHTVLLADFMNKPSTTLSNSAFQFYSEKACRIPPNSGVLCWLAPISTW